jgi:hypothetical protein
MTKLLPQIVEFVGGTINNVTNKLQSWDLDQMIKASCKHTIHSLSFSNNLLTKYASLHVS